MVWTSLLPASSFNVLTSPRTGSSPPEVGQSQGEWLQKPGSFGSLYPSSWWPNPTSSLEEEGRSSWRRVDGSTGCHWESQLISRPLPKDSQCLLSWHQTCPGLLKVLMSSPHILGCDQRPCFSLSCDLIQRMSYSLHKHVYLSESPAASFSVSHFCIFGHLMSYYLPSICGKCLGNLKPHHPHSCKLLRNFLMEDLNINTIENSLMNHHESTIQFQHNLPPHFFVIVVIEVGIF